VSETLYTVQTLVIGVVLLLLLRKSSVILQLQVTVWVIGVIALVYRFGPTEQLNFYSNDQSYYVNIVNDLNLWNVALDVDWWTSYAKIPYTLPAAIITWLGLDSGLALKTVSLICLLLVTQLVLSEIRQATLRHALITVFFTACGGIGILYSILALRETMMMLLVTYFCVSRSPTVRITSFFLLLLLRLHLAAALAVAALVVFIWETMRDRRDSTHSVAGLIAVGVLGGELLFAVGLWWQSGLQWSVAQNWGINTFTRIFSNLVGLQFLTVRSESVELSISSLLLLRVLLSETILIPALFTTAVLLRPERVTTQARLALVTLCLYVSLASNTDFNSFRQNIPLMVVMGMVVLNIWFPRTEVIPSTDSLLTNSRTINSAEKLG
jgi:hypothetical protein